MKQHPKTNVVLVLLFCMTVACDAKLPDENLKVRIVDYGVMEAVTRETVSETPGTPSGKSRRAYAQVTSTTNRIPAKIGVRFGIMYTVQGLGAQKEVVFKKVVTHPEITKPDGKKSKGFTFEEKHRPVNGTVANFTGYGFDHAYELAIGKWNFELWHENVKLFEKTFEVYKPVDLGEQK